MGAGKLLLLRVLWAGDEKLGWVFRGDKIVLEWRNLELAWATNRIFFIS